MKESTFKPAWWLRSAHLQTIWPVFFRKRRKPDLINERVELNDGDFLDLSWGKASGGPVVLILHGLEGSIHSHYAGSLMLSLERAGFRPVFMHFRGCSGEPNRLPRSYHSGDTDDLAFVVEHISRQSATPVHAAVGFSLGGNVLLKWLGQSGADNPLQCGVAVSVPFVLADAATRLERGLSHMYEMYLVRSLKQSYRRKFSRMKSPLDVEIDELKGFWDIDDRVTAPLHGFDGVDHYYGESSCRQYLSGIKRRTRIIHALDDPFMFARSVPESVELNEHVELLLAERGGHVGFVSGRYPWKPEYWYEQQIIEFLNSGMRRQREQNDA